LLWIQTGEYLVAMNNRASTQIFTVGIDVT
jgi:hypothetical protein